jgi:saccharopine dehydrogenase-like NADP-dependent oxidoreductase
MGTGSRAEIPADRARELTKLTPEARYRELLKELEENGEEVEETEDAALLGCGIAPGLVGAILGTLA